MTTHNSLEFAIVLIGGILSKLQEYSEMAEAQEPDFIETTEIDYIATIPEIPLNRPDVYALEPEPVYTFKPKTTLTEF